MSDFKDPDRPSGFEEAVPDAASDHAYEMWVRRKIERALRRSLENPQRYSLDEVMRRFGLEP